MVSEGFLPIIAALAVGRFEIDSDGERRAELMGLASESLIDRGVVRLRRAGSAGAGWRTLLICVVEGVEGVRLANRWAAEVRDALLEPEVADLYLILTIAGVAEHQCAAIEADDKFCRRFVSRPGEAQERLLARTFLAQVGVGVDAGTITEPLTAALSRTATTNAWLDAGVRELWRAALLSGKTGVDLADVLTAAVPTQGTIA